MKPFQAILVLVILAIIVSIFAAVAQWSPEHQAQAELMLRTPVPSPTPAQVVIDAQVEEQEETVRTWGAVGRVMLVFVGICACSLLLALGLTAVSRSARHVKATRQLAPMAALPRGSHIQLPSGIYHKASGAFDAIDAPQLADYKRLRMLTDGDIAKLAALAAAVRVAATGSRVEQRVLELTERA